MSEGVISISAGEGREHGLPALGFRVDLAGSALRATRFPDADTYLVMSGPPGGPLVAIVAAFRDPGRDAAALERGVRGYFAHPAYGPLRAIAPATLDVAGARRVAVTLLTGRHHACTAWCAALVAQPHDGEALLLLLGVGVPESLELVDPGVIVGQRDLAGVMRTLDLEPRRGESRAPPEVPGDGGGHRMSPPRD